MGTVEALGFFLGILGALPVVGLAAAKLTDIRRKNKLSYLWRMNDQGWAIIKPRYAERMARIEDVIAAQKLRDWFTRNQIDFVDIDDSKEVPKDRNLILICGPEANKVSAKVASSLHLSFEYRFDRGENRPYIFDHSTGAKLWSPSDESGQSNDLALVAKLTPKGSTNVWVLCWGLHGPGTTGGAQALLESEFIGAVRWRPLLDVLRNRRRHEDFVAVVGVPYVSFDSTKTPKLHAIRKGADAYVEVTQQ
jgi:hypothetical protein